MYCSKSMRFIEKISYHRCFIDFFRTYLIRAAQNLHEVQAFLTSGICLFHFAKQKILGYVFPEFIGYCN